MKPAYRRTLVACFSGYIVQAIIVNFLPLLFLTFQSQYGIPLSTVTFLVTFNFGLQLLVDLISPGIIARVGQRASLVTAHVLAAAGFLALVVLPECFADPFVGLLIAVVLYATGGGLLEVLVSPVVESCPTENKEGTMSLLHSFYCWGHVGVVLISTAFFFLFGIENWKILAAVWALLPIANAVLFSRVPLAPLLEEGETEMPLKELLGSRRFWMFVLLMVCAGASEQAIAQWVSAFAEQGLGITKTLGDLAGPLFFATMMGLCRVLYGKFSEKWNLKNALLVSGVGCVVCYLVIAFSPWPVLGLLGCGACGFAVGILWPGTFSMAAATMRRGATMMFAYLALAGDLGCTLGPTLAGNVAAALGDNLHIGILASVVFPVVLVVGVLFYRRSKT